MQIILVRHRVLSPGITCFQLAQSTSQYANMDYKKIITPAEKDQIKYPPIRLRYLHWIYWVDWDKAKNLHISKPALLDGLSYIAKGFSSEKFDTDKAKDKFLEFFTKNNIARLTEFYSMITAKVALLSGSNIDASAFEFTEMIFKYPHFVYCYTIPEIKNYTFLQNQELSLSSLNGLLITMRIEQTKYANLKSDFLSLEEYRYHIGNLLKATYGINFFNNISNEKIRELYLPALLYLKMLCCILKMCAQKKIHFLPLNKENPNFEPANQKCDLEHPEFVEHDKFCANICLQRCEIWSYDLTVTSVTVPNYGLENLHNHKLGRQTTLVAIKYPTTDDVMLLTETDPWTWEDFVGNIGGLLGIWTGASVLSIFQLVYLCCCAKNEINISPTEKPTVVVKLSPV